MLPGEAVAERVEAAGRCVLAQVERGLWIGEVRARIRLGDGGQPSAISDAGSANGTLVQDERSEAETWVDLGPDMDITFGDREFTLLSAERLVEILDGL